MAKRFTLVETNESSSGKGFSAANNSVIKSYGAKRVSGLTDEWVRLEMTSHAADVKRALASTTKLKKDGKLIIIDDELGECMLDEKTRKKIQFINKGGPPVMHLWIRKPDEENEAMQAQQKTGSANSVDEENNTGFLGLGFD